MAIDQICATCKFAEKQDFNPGWVQCHFRMPCHADMPKYSKQTDGCELWQMETLADLKEQADGNS